MIGIYILCRIKVLCRGKAPRGGGALRNWKMNSFFEMTTLLFFLTLFFHD